MTTAHSVHRASVRSTADVAALEEKGLSSLLPAWTFAGILDHYAQACPAKSALVHIDEVGKPARIMDFATYRARVFQAANLFRSLANGKAPVVAVILPFLPDTFIAMWGGAIAGRYVPINPFLDVEHAAAILRASGAEILVTTTGEAGKGVWDRLVELRELAPAVHTTLIAAPTPGAGETFMAAMAEHPERLSFVPDQKDAHECAFMHTGGTTSSPKLVRHTEHSQLLQGWLCGMAMGCEEDTVFAHAMPDFHVGGAIASGTRGLVYGQTIVTLTRDGFRNPSVLQSFWDIVAEHGITAIVTAPTTAAALVAAGGDGPRTLTRYTTGGGPLPAQIAHDFRDTFGIALKEVWGGTEFHGILSFHYDGDVAPRLGSCGRTIPFHWVLSAILDGNRFVRPAKADERGVLIATGPTTIPGYVDPANNAGFFVEDGPDGLTWASTGDVGWVDDDGFVWIFGREKDVIIRGGHNIDSALIDEAMAAHPAVLHAAAVGKPCPLKGELPIAYVELRPGAEVTIDELMAHARDTIQERAAVPLEIHRLASMPMTAVGKVSKPDLRRSTLRALVQDLLPNAQVAVNERGGRLIAKVAVATENERNAAAGMLAPYPFASDVKLHNGKS